MLHLMGALLVVALTCTSSQALESTITEKILRIDPDSSKSLVQGTLFTTDDNSYPYAICEFTKPKVEKTCNVTLITPHEKERTCDNVKVTAGKGRELFLNGFLQVIPFQKDHVIVAWWDDKKEKKDKKQNFKVSILNMNTCKTADLDFPIDVARWGFFPGLVLYPDQVHVVLNSKATCKSDESCRVAYDLDGKQIGDPHPYQPKLSGYATPVSSSSPKKGFFEYVKEEKKYTVLLVDKAGRGKELQEVDLEGDGKNPRIYFSGSDGLFAICRVPDSESDGPTSLICSQFNAEGKITAHSSATLKKNVGWLAARNLAEGKILVATSGCNDEPAPHKDCRDFRVTTMTAAGQEGPSLKVRGPELKCHDMLTNLQVRISETKNHYCFDLSCLPTESHLKYGSTCVLKSDVNAN